MKRAVIGRRVRALVPLTAILVGLIVVALVVDPSLPGWIRVASTAVEPAGGAGLSATYYNNVDFTGGSVSRTDPVIDFDWGGGSPAPGIDPTTYSVRWTGTLTAPRTGTYRISTRSDDGVRVRLGGELLVNSWTAHAPMENSGSIVLTGGVPYPIEVEYFQQSQGSLLSLMWSGPGVPRAVIATRYLATSATAPSPTASPTASASPTATPAPQSSPSSAPTATPAPVAGSGALPNHPTAACTGVPAGTQLTVLNGNQTVNTPNTVIDGKDIRGCVEVRAPGVVIRRSKISCGNFYVIASFGGAYTGTGLLVEDSEIDCQNTSGTGLGDNNLTARRVNIHSCENGFSMDANFVVEDAYIHDLYNSAESHTDGIELEGGANITISHNTILAGEGTSAIITNPSLMSNLLIRDNLLAGGAYTLYCPRDSSSGVRVLNNRVSRMYHPTGGAYGPWTDCEKVAQASGNVWDDTGQPLAY